MLGFIWHLWEGLDKKCERGEGSFFRKKYFSSTKVCLVHLYPTLHPVKLAYLRFPSGIQALISCASLQRNGCIMCPQNMLCNFTASVQLYKQVYKRYQSTLKEHTHKTTCLLEYTYISHLNLQFPCLSHLEAMFTFHRPASFSAIWPYSEKQLEPHIRNVIT